MTESNNTVPTCNPGNHECRLMVFAATLGLMILLLLMNTSATAGEKTDLRLRAYLDTIHDNDELLAWVYFTDKGSKEYLKDRVPADVVSDHSIQRRLKVRSPEEVVDYTDLPVEETYVAQIASRIAQVRQRSKWFNGVSVRGTKLQIAALEELPFVREIGFLTRFRKNTTDLEMGGTPTGNEGIQRGLAKTTSLDYGQSFVQNNLVNVPAVHNTGNFAQGVMVGVFDNGVRLPNHEAFDSLDIIATYDFVDHKESIVPNNPSISFGSHGVYTLSAIGGYVPGQLIGPAFGATFILARTENDSSETPLEEDNWVAAMEWADSIGVEVTSTSLGYLTYDPPYQSWEWQDMDGNTTVITRGADMAVARGIVVLNSAGNSGSNSSHNTLVAPADGDSVIAVGAVSSSGQRASFSSVGPTTSTPPRIKPDVMADGVSVFTASSSNTRGYTSVSGTSLSCPLAAGVAALIVHDRPDATPVEIADAMRSTASNAATPDNENGWGILDAAAAIAFLGEDIPCSAISSIAARCIGGGTKTVQARVNLLGSTIYAGKSVTITIDDIPYSSTIVTNGTNSRANFSVPGWSAGDHIVSLVDPPGCLADKHATCVAGDAIADVDPEWGDDASWAAGVASHGTELLGNYPNPLNPSTNIQYTLGEETHVTLKIYNTLGQEVATLVNEVQAAGSRTAVWNGRNDFGASVASGIYICTLEAGSVIRSQKLLLLK